MTRFTWLVYGFAAERRFQREPIASFFDYSDAALFAMHPERDGFERRNCFIDEGQYDRRRSGYRPPEKPSGYEAWLIELSDLGNGKHRVSA
jgi:hypothetical protein